MADFGFIDVFNLLLAANKAKRVGFDLCPDSDLTFELLSENLKTALKSIR